MSVSVEDMKQLKITNKNNLIEKLKVYGKSRVVIAETDRLFICAPTLLDILMHGNECSTIPELATILLEEHGENAEQEVKDILQRGQDPQQMLWLFFLPKTPFGQASFFLKDWQYIGQCRFYIPQGEDVPHCRGGYSGGPQNLPLGYAEKSIHLLEKFTGKGYGVEGLSRALEVIIKPVIGTKPLVFTGMDTDNNPIFQPTAYPFLGLATTTGLKNIASLKANLKTGLVPGKLVNYPGDFQVSSIRYIDFRYPSPTKETPKTQEFLKEWLEESNRLGHKYMDAPYVTDASGMCNYGWKPEALMIYHKLLRKFSFDELSSNEDLISHESFLNDLCHKTLMQELTPTPLIKIPKVRTLVWQFAGKTFDFKSQVLNLSSIPEKNVIRHEP